MNVLPFILRIEVVYADRANGTLVFFAVFRSFLLGFTFFLGAVFYDSLYLLYFSFPLERVGGT